jgi:Cadherin-like
MLCVVFFFVFGVVMVNSQPAPTASRLLQYSMLEQLPVGSIVGDVIRDANLTDRYIASDLQRFRFQIRSANSRFTIDERLGVIRNTEELDREQLCPDNSLASCQLTFDVTIRPPQFFQIFKVSVHIVDINDNSPVFQEEQVQFTYFIFSNHFLIILFAIRSVIRKVGLF